MDQFAFITGATSGFGEATARVLSQNGYSLILMARRQDRLEKLKGELSSEKCKVIIIQTDVRNENDVLTSVNSLPNEVKSNIHIAQGLVVGISPLLDYCVICASAQTTEQRVACFWDLHPALASEPW